MEYQEKMALLDEKRKEALTRQDALLYRQLTDELGIVLIEDRNLYEQGLLLERLNKTKNLSGEQRTNYSPFLEEVVDIGVDAAHLSAQTETKRRLLSEYFPKRFAQGGKQPIDNYNPAQVGVIFNGILRTAKKLEEI